MTIQEVQIHWDRAEHQTDVMDQMVAASPLPSRRIGSASDGQGRAVHVKEFISEMSRHLPPAARMIVCQFRGDPVSDGDWRASALSNPRQLDERANVYLCVSAMCKGEGGWRRTKANFAGGLCLMIDDLGDGPGSRAPLSTIKALKPTAMVETSPSNYQAIYMFDGLVTDQALFNRLIDAFVKQRLLDADPGMKGVTRVFRPPFGINGKSKYRIDGACWQVRLVEWSPVCRYSVDQIAKAFGLILTPPIPLRRSPPDDPSQNSDQIRAFVSVRHFLRSRGMLHSEEVSADGWQSIQCPWTAEHTNAADTGAALAEPSVNNGNTGAFRCHHGHCQNKRWRDLTDWVSDEMAEELEAVNSRELGDCGFEVGATP